MNKKIALVAAIVFLTGSGAFSGTVDLLPGSQVSSSINASSQTDNVTSLPFTAAGGMADSTGSSNVSYKLTQVSFDIAIRQISLTNGFSGSAAGELLFSTTDDLDFQLRSSFLESIGLPAIGRIDLIDLSTGSSFSDGSVSVWDQNITGRLRGGHAYSLRYELESTWRGLSPDVPASRSLGNPTLNTGSTVSASLQFEIQAAVVPLPAAAWMGMVLLGSVGGLGYLCKRRNLEQ